MRYFEKQIGINGAKAIFYLQEPNKEIDINRKSPVMIIVPGGAYMWTSWREEEPIALEFLSKGFSCIVAKYATEGLSFYDGKHDYSKDPVTTFPNPLVDLAKTIAYVRKNADKWSLDKDSVNVIGFSAGGNLTAQLGTYWNTDWLEKLAGKNRKEYQPNSICLAYGAPHMAMTPEKDRYKQTKKFSGPNMIDYATLGHNQSQKRIKMVNMIDAVTKDVPPTFIWHTMEDPYVPVASALHFAEQLEEKMVPFELHIYQKGKHGLALADFRTDSKKDRSQSNKQASSWKRLYLGWLTENKLVHLF